jgi:sugar lactone lactonase YvrE
MKTDNRGPRSAVLLCGALALLLTGASAKAQSIYTPYSFANFAGRPGGPGFADGSGSEARFRSPIGVAVDSDGNLYVADKNNFVIRKITPDGVVTTLAGSHGQPGSNDGIGTAAKFGSAFGGPTSVALDAAGNVFVTDTDNFTIRKICLSRLLP